MVFLVIVNIVVYMVFLSFVFVVIITINIVTNYIGKTFYTVTCTVMTGLYKQGNIVLEKTVFPIFALLQKQNVPEKFRLLTFHVVQICKKRHTFKSFLVCRGCNGILQKLTYDVWETDKCIQLEPAVRRLNKTIHRINHYPVDTWKC